MNESRFAVRGSWDGTAQRRDSPIHEPLPAASAVHPRIAIQMSVLATTIGGESQ
jgi:hypothetical protein